MDRREKEERTRDAISQIARGEVARGRYPTQEAAEQRVRGAVKRQEQIEAREK